MVFRDYAQGAYRMRGIGKGQRLRLIITPEVSRPRKKPWSLGAGQRPDERERRGATREERVLRDVCAWLVVNTARSERTQFNSLCEQSTPNTWRRAAVTRLRERMELVGAPIEEPSAASADPDKAIVQACIDCFRERLDTTVLNAVPLPPAAATALGRLVEDHSVLVNELLDECARDRRQPPSPGRRRGCVYSARRLWGRTAHPGWGECAGERRGGRAGAGTGAGTGYEGGPRCAQCLPSHHAPRHAHEIRTGARMLIRDNLSHTASQSKNRSNRRSSSPNQPFDSSTPARVRHSDSGILAVSVRFPQTDADGSGKQPFYPLSGMAIRGKREVDTSALSFPPYLLVSRNWYHKAWSLLPSRMPRRIKSVIVAMEWSPDVDAVGSSGVDDGTITTLSPAQEARLKSAFDIFDTDGSGTLSVSEFCAVLRACEIDAAGIDQAKKELEKNDADGDGQVDFDELKRIVARQTLYHIKSGRYFALLSLAEAETVRAALHHSTCSSSSSLFP